MACVAKVLNFGRSPDGTEFVLRAFPVGGYVPWAKCVPTEAGTLYRPPHKLDPSTLDAQVRFEDEKCVQLEDGRMVRPLQLLHAQCVVLA